MTTTRTPWRASVVATVDTNSPADRLAALHDLIVAEVAAHPSTAQWTVSDYDATDGHLELKKLQTADDVRILIFGGRTPNAAAVFDSGGSGTLAAGLMYGGISPTAGTDGPDEDYASGSPYNDPFIAVPWASNTSNTGQVSGNRIRYMENNAGMVVIIHGSTTNHTGILMVGDLIDAAADGAPVFMANGTGGNSSTTSSRNHRLLPTALTTSISGSETGRMFWAAYDLSNKTYSPFTTALRSGTAQRCLGPGNYSGTGGAFPSALKTTDNATSFLIPIPIVNVTGGEFLGYLRQIMIGPRAAIGHILIKDDQPYARAVSADPINVADALWLVD